MMHARGVSARSLCNVVCVKLLHGLKDVSCLDISSCGLLWNRKSPFSCLKKIYLQQSLYPKQGDFDSTYAIVWLSDMYINYSLPQALIFRPLRSSFACLLSGRLCILSTYGIAFFQSWISTHLIISLPNVSSRLNGLSHFYLLCWSFFTVLYLFCFLSSPLLYNQALHFFAFLCVLICPSLRGISCENKVTY